MLPQSRQRRLGVAAELADLELILARCELVQEMADVGHGPRRVEGSGQAHRVPAVGARFVKFPLERVPDGQQRHVERPAPDVTQVHVQRPQGVLLGLAALSQRPEAVGDLGGELGLVKVGEPHRQFIVGGPPEGCFRPAQRP